MSIVKDIQLQLDWDLRYFGILRSVEWQFRADVSAQPIGTIFKAEEIQEDSWKWGR